VYSLAARRHCEFPILTARETVVQSFDPDTGVPPFFRENLRQLGNAIRRFFHGPGINNWDIAFHKNMKITERQT
jgi:hypothetical protein